MKTYECGHFQVEVTITGAGPFTAVGILQPYGSLQPLRRVDAEGSTEAEAETAVLKLARAAAAEMFFDDRYKRYID